MPLSRSRKVIYSAVTALGLLGGSAAVASATSSSTGGGNDTNNPSYTSSVTAPDDENEQGLASVATATADQARQAAIADTGGTVQKVELENENGNVVYGVAVTLPDGRQVDVKVDAGNAKVLTQEAGDASESGNEKSGDQPGQTDGEQGSESADNTAPAATNG
jgi:uncharacterized membrane protein YkoI